MGIAEDIKQKSFQSELHKSVINIIYTGNWLLSLHGKSLKEYGISTQQFNILRILKGQFPNPASVNLLKDRMLDKMSNASRLVEKLRLKGLIERNTCPDDRRQVDVLITKKGLSLLEQIDSRPQFFDDKEILEESEAQILNELLDKFRNKVKS
ncbi:MAG: MarR family transcriptional regulator [Flavobacteriales bacterium]|nr:MarR family transcriptional regulator [Flavobacteriales bacterium]